MHISADSVVSIHYTLTADGSEKIDSSVGGEPLLYLHGRAQIITGLENALEGKAVGDKLAVDVAPEEGYGNYDPELDLRIGKEAFPQDQLDQLVPGARFQAQHPKNPDDVAIFEVHGVEDDAVLVSGNHPLAGRQLHFDVEVVEIREATPTELEHGHALPPEAR